MTANVVDIRTRRAPVTRASLEVPVTLTVSECEDMFWDLRTSESRQVRAARMKVWEAMVSALTAAGFPHPSQGDAA